MAGARTPAHALGCRGTEGLTTSNASPLLHRPERHEALCDAAWEPGRVRCAIEAIATDAAERYARDRRWPAHPLDQPGELIPGLYMGSAGAVWAVDWLAERGFCERLPSIDDWLDELVEGSRRLLPSLPNWKPPSSPAYLLGDLGTALVRWRHTRTPASADALYERLSEPERMPTREMMWGSPGVALALTFLLRETGEERWRTLLEREVEGILADWLPRDCGCDLWEQDVYGVQEFVLDTVHGAVGNVHVLLLAADALGDERRAEIERRGIAIATRFAEVHDGQANWPATWPSGRFGINGWLLHYCHGAPGFVISLDPIKRAAHPELDTLLEQASELVWRAGPLSKGPNLCHGTAGNGYALLKTFRRTGDPRWLERARRFAMHAISQVEHARETQGHGRYTLWTGDPGVAIYLAHCLDPAQADFPTLDFF